MIKYMNHQDWNPVIIHGKAVTFATRGSNPKHYERTKEQKIEDEEIGTHKTVPLSMAKMIQQGRIAKGFKTQKDLAIAVGVNANIINAYESGKAIPDSALLQKLRRVLGVKLK
jgi:putative transcription factor